MARSKKVQTKNNATPARVTRAGAAKLLGVSVRTVQRMEGKELHPVIERAIHYFDVEDVATVAAARRTSPMQLSGGELAAELFARFDAGKEFKEIVRELRVTPAAVREHYEEWSTDLGCQPPRGGTKR